jgi:hypothetical protein
MAIPEELVERAKQWVQKYGVEIDFNDHAGDGTDGAVWRTANNTAVKVLLDSCKYDTELRCYQRLKERGIDKIFDLQIPVIASHDDELLAIEMDIVEPPFLLDFGKAYIDGSSPYTPEQMAAAERMWSCTFPKKDLKTIRLVLAKLRGLGIEYMDPNPRNICLRADSEEQLDEDYTDFEQGSE